MKKILFLCLFLPLLSKAQDFDSWGMRLGFTHTNRSHNLGFVGASLNYSDQGNGYFIAIPTAGTFYAGTHIGANPTSSKVQLIPEVGFEASIIILGAGISVNTQAIQPRIGLSILNMLSGHIGYSLPFRENATFEGLTVTLALKFCEN